MVYWLVFYIRILRQVIIDKVSYDYNQTPAITDITFDVDKSDFFVLVGPNGGGKSTILKVIAGLLEPISGTVSFERKAMAEVRAQGKIGYVPQNFGKNIADFPATVEEIVNLGLVVNTRSKSKKGQTQVIENLMQTFELKDFSQRRLCDLSGGQQQKVMLARALAGEPELILLDEPTSGIDYDASEKIYLLLKDINERLGITIIMVSHDIDRATLYATKVTCIRRNLCFYGNSAEFRKIHLAERHFW